MTIANIEQHAAELLARLNAEAGGEAKFEITEYVESCFDGCLDGAPAVRVSSRCWDGAGEMVEGDFCYSADDLAELFGLDDKFAAFCDNGRGGFDLALFDTEADRGLWMNQI